MELDPHAIDAVLLDSGGVLLLPSPDSMRRLLGELGARPDDDLCARAHYAGTREVDRIGEADWPAADMALARVAGVPEERLAEAIPLLDQVYVKEPWVPVPGAAEALLDLEAAGYALAVVSNAFGTMEEYLAEHRICRVGGGPAAHVAIVVDSHVVGVEKPDPRIFEIALDALGVDAADAWYVGDMPGIDVAGARNAGLWPIVMDPFDFQPDADYARVASLHEVAALISSS